MTEKPHPARAHLGSRWGAQDLAYIAVFAALLAVSGYISIPLGFGVPITLQTLFITLAALTLGAGRACAATTLYVLLGLLGLPIFAGGKGGIGVLAGPTVGYLLSFPLMALVIGWLAYYFSQRWGNRKLLAPLWYLAGLAGMLLNTVSGIAGMVWGNAHLPLDKAVPVALTFVPGELIKIALAVLIALAVRRGFPQLLRT